MSQCIVVLQVYCLAILISISVSFDVQISYRQSLSDDHRAPKILAPKKKTAPKVNGSRTTFLEGLL
jgi:hypothetical protein